MLRGSGNLAFLEPVPRVKVVGSVLSMISYLSLGLLLLRRRGWDLDWLQRIVIAFVGGDGSENSTSMMI